MGRIAQALDRGNFIPLVRDGAKTVLDGVGLVKGYSYWTFSDIFEEGGMPSAAFHGGFGLLTLRLVLNATGYVLSFVRNRPVLELPPISGTEEGAE